MGPAEVSIAPGLLLAMPQLQDSNFSKAVVLMVEHGEEGSFGLVLNHASELPVTTLLDAMDLSWNGSTNAVVWRGGPVMESSGWVLHEVDGDEFLSTDFQDALEEGRTLHITDSIGLSASPSKLQSIAEDPPERVRFLLGYAGWGPGQLSEEMAHGAWLHADITADLIFQTDPDLMWLAAMQSIGINPQTLVPSHGIH